MRPKKKVLLWGTDEDELSRLGYVLWSRQMKPVLASTEAGAMAAIETEIDCAVVLCHNATLRCGELMREMQAARPDLPILLVRAGDGPPIYYATRVLTDFGVAPMVEAIRALCSRRRGPKKKAGSIHQAKAVSAAAGGLSDLRRVG